MGSKVSKNPTSDLNDKLTQIISGDVERLAKNDKITEKDISGIINSHSKEFSNLIDDYIKNITQNGEINLDESELTNIMNQNFEQINSMIDSSEDKKGSSKQKSSSKKEGKLSDKLMNMVSDDVERLAQSDKITGKDISNIITKHSKEIARLVEDLIGDMSRGEKVEFQ